LEEVFGSEVGVAGVVFGKLFVEMFDVPSLVETSIELFSLGTTVIGDAFWGRPV